MSRSSVLPINVLLIFDMHDLNDALFLKVSFCFLLVFIMPTALTLPLTTISTSL